MFSDQHPVLYRIPYLREDKYGAGTVSEYKTKDFCAIGTVLYFPLVTSTFFVPEKFDWFKFYFLYGTGANFCFSTEQVSHPRSQYYLLMYMKKCQ